MAWCISTLLWCTILFLFDISIGLVWIIFAIISAMIFKKILFSEKFIQSHLWFPAKKESKAQEFQEPTILKDDEYLEPIHTTIESAVVFENRTETFEESEFELMIKKWNSWIKVFFSENLLAKLWAILIFLWVVFFLTLVYQQVWDVAKMLIGLISWMIFYWVGVWLHTKGYANESKIMLWLGILINYLVILSGRYIIGTDGILSEGLTFIFLILNTVFAVATSLVYTSNMLLLFGFIVAYLNPFLVWGSSETPYTLVGYTLIVSMGALFMAANNKNIALFIISLIFGNLLILIAPESAVNQGIIQLIGFNFLYLISLWAATKFSDNYKTLLEIVFGGWFFILGMFIFSNIAYCNELSYMIAAISSGFVLMLGGYMMSFQKPYLYSIATVGWVLTLGSVILISGADMFNGAAYHNGMLIISIISIIVFALTHSIFPFINTTLMREKKYMSSFLTSNITGVLFLWVMLFIFGETFFPWLALGVSFLALAILYFLYLFICIHILGINNIKQDSNSQSIVYTIIGVIFSLVAIAVAFIFSKYPEIIGTLWLFESTLAFYFFSRFRNWKLYIVGIVLFVIWILKFAGLINIVEEWNFTLLISLSIVFISLVLNIIFISPKLTEKAEWYDMTHSILHLCAIWFFTTLLIIIIPSTGYGWGVLWVSIFICILAWIYGYYCSRVLKHMFLVIFSLFAIYHIMIFDTITWRIARDEVQYLQVLQYISSLLMVLSYWLYKKYNTLSHLSSILGAILWGYLFIITTMYVFYIFQNSFTITIYWGLLSFSFLMYGISKNIIKIRTIGLYIILLTAGKVFFYDIWYNFDDAISRVVALIFVWILMIIISTQYTKKYGNNLTGEFSIKNFIGK